jgi:prephenate dehydratase
MKIAIQGIQGCFHQIAANNYFGYNIDVLPCLSFDELIDSVLHQKYCDFGIMAIENSIAGSILQNYKLLQKSGLKIIGETYLKIEQNLIVPKGMTLAEIKEVHSHSMAIYQCDEFLKEYIPQAKLVEMEDTALSVKELDKNLHLKKAAIGSRLSAEIYGQEILKEAIQTNKKNYTRFLVISKTATLNLEETNKASISLQAIHEKGSLAKVLALIADANINLSKLQSYPILGSDWEYYFHLDLEYESYADFQKMIVTITPHTSSIKILGNYKAGKR